MLVTEPTVTRDPSEFARTPLTLAIFGVLAGYYIAYAIGLVRWRARLTSIGGQVARWEALTVSYARQPDGR